MLAPDEIDRLIHRIADRARPEQILIFGSYAKGTAGARSDLDLLVVKETDLPVAQRAADLTPICAGYLVPIDLHVYTPEEVREYAKEKYSFIHTVLGTGRIVYDRSRTRFTENPAQPSLEEFSQLGD